MQKRALIIGAGGQNRIFTNLIFKTKDNRPVLIFRDKLNMSN